MTTPNKQDIGLTDRQARVLRLVADDLNNHRNWSDRVLTGQVKPGQQARITWDEMLWLQAKERLAFAVHIEATLIVDRITKATRIAQPTQPEESSNAKP